MREMRKIEKESRKERGGDAAGSCGKTSKLISNSILCCPNKLRLW